MRLRILHFLTIFLTLTLVVAPGRAASRIVRDSLGREVRIPDRADRIVCLAPNLTETVYALGLGDEVVGVTDYTDHPSAARLKPHVGGLIDPSIEMIVSLRPDLVLADAGINREQTIDQLQHLHIPVFVVRSRNLNGVFESIRQIGEATGRERAADALVKSLEAQQARIVARVRGLARPKVLVLIWYQPVITAGKSSFITGVIAAAGGRSVTANIPRESPQISMERVLQLSPDFLLLVRGHGGVTLAMLRANPAWSQVPAVRGGRVIYMDDRLFHASPVVFDALAELAKKLHPRRFETSSGAL
jgi:iron complex transport system substrate-binding protein